MRRAGLGYLRAWSGTGYAHETAQLFGDEIALNVAASRQDQADPRDTFATFLPLLTRGRPRLEQARLVVAALTRGPRFATAYTAAACEVGRDAARRLRLPDGVQRRVYPVYELWRGGGVPDGLVGDDVPTGSRLARLTGIAVLFDTIGGTDLAVDAVRQRSGGMLAPLVGSHHERVDGSGYDRGSTHSDLRMPARVLAAADAYQAMTQRRPHRPALSGEQAQHHLLADARAGGLDGDAVRAVLAAAGHDAGPVRRTAPSGLTDREVEVLLRLVAQGCSNAMIGQRLTISRRTAEHHVQHIYTKLGVSSRAAAALFAMEHHLLAPDGWCSRCARRCSRGRVGPNGAAARVRRAQRARSCRRQVVNDQQGLSSAAP